MSIKEDAIKIYDELKRENPLFPNTLCKIAVIKMHEIGYGIIQGKVNLDNYCSLGMEESLTHYWNYDPCSREEVDITSEQFNIHLFEADRLPKIFILPPEERPEIYEEMRRGLESYEVI